MNAIDCIIYLHAILPLARVDLVAWEPADASVSMSLAAIPHAFIHVAWRVAPDAVAVRLTGVPFAVVVWLCLRAGWRWLRTSIFNASLYEYSKLVISCRKINENIQFFLSRTVSFKNKEILIQMRLTYPSRIPFSQVPEYTIRPSADMKVPFPCRIPFVISPT